MYRITLAVALALFFLMVCGNPPHIDAQPGDTKVVIGDAASILLRAQGLDNGATWSFNKSEIRHRNAAGVLAGLQVVEAGADRCSGDAMCGVPAGQPWKVEINYGAGTVTVQAVGAHRGFRINHRNLPFDQWQTTANADEREFGHGDGRRISAVKVNGGASLCSGNGCQVTFTFSPR
jgi:hypothetical protein